MKRLPLQFQIRSDFQYLPFLTQLFYKLKAKDSFRLTQILVEAFNNAVVHGHRGKKEKWVELQILTGPKESRMTVSDEGQGFPPHKKHPTLWQTHGRGLKLIHSFATKVKNYRKGKRHCLEAKIFHE